MSASPAECSHCRHYHRRRLARPCCLCEAVPARCKDRTSVAKLWDWSRYCGLQTADTTAALGPDCRRLEDDCHAR